MTIQEHITWGCMLFIAILLIAAALWIPYIWRRHRKKMQMDMLLHDLIQLKDDVKSRFYFYHVTEDTFYHFDETGHFLAVDPQVMLVSELSEMAMHVRAVATDVLSGKLPTQVLLMNEAHSADQSVFQLFIEKMGPHHVKSNELLQIFLNDVTEGYRTRKQLYQNQVRFDAIFNHTSYSVMFFDQDGVMVDLNEIGVQHLFGKSREDILSQHLKIHEVFDVPAPSDDMQPTILCVLDPRGNYETAITPMFDDNHHITGAFLICRDISHLVAADHRHKEYIHKFKELREQMNVYINQADLILKDNMMKLLVYDPSKSIVDIRSQVLEEGEKVRVIDILQWIIPADRYRIISMYQEMNKLMDKSYDEDFETTAHHRYGANRVLHICYVPVKNQEGEVTHYSGMSFDATDRAKTEREIQIATQAARENEKIKKNFLTNVSLDVHTPIDKVLRNVELLGMDISEEEQQKSINAIQQDSMQLLDLINDVLMYSRLEANRVEIKKEEVDLGAQFESVCQQALPENTTVKLKVINPYEHLTTDVDIPNLIQILRMLMKAAIRFIHEGELQLSCRYIYGNLLLTIEDHGEGMPEKRKQEIYAIMAESNDPDVISDHLPFTVAYTLVKMMNGKLELQSNMGSGTTTCVTLPCEVKEITLKKNN